VIEQIVGVLENSSLSLLAPGPSYLLAPFYRSFLVDNVPQMLRVRQAQASDLRHT